MLIVSEKAPGSTQDQIQSFKAKNIKYIEVGTEPKMSLGQLRNLAIESCNGKYFCQWDDDDWYHNRRLEIQMDEIVKNYKPASVLTNWMMYDAVRHQAFLSYVGPWAGSVLCKKDLYYRGLKHPDLNKKEDADFMNTLYEMNCVFPVLKPFLYLYVFHGNNTWDSLHFDTLFSKSQKLSGNVSDLMKKILERKVSNNLASKLIGGPRVLREINYFFNWQM